MTLGAINENGLAGLNGSIAFLALYERKILRDTDIKLHHQVSCRWYNIDHDPITII